MPINHVRIHENGWRQGKVLTVDDSDRLLRELRARRQPIAIPEGTRLVVASHSCDVCSPSELEVNCEFCPAVPLEANARTDGLGFGRDPRRLRLPITVNGAPVLHEMYAPLRFTADRSSLETMLPDPSATITDDDLHTLEHWLAARVRRRVLPNAFDRRLDTRNAKRIRRAIAPVEPHIHQLLYSLSPQTELTDEEEPYQLAVVLLARSASMRDPDTMANLETAKDAIEEILSERPGIQATVSIAGDETMTYAQFRLYARWGFEDLSLEMGAELPDDAA